MRKIIVIVALVAIAAIPVFGQWHADFRVTNNISNSYTPYYSGGWGVAADDADVCITWYDYTNSPYYARYHTFPIGSPAQTPNGEAVSTYYAYQPVIAIHNGERFVSWYYSYPYSLHTRERNGSWGPILDHGYYYSWCYYPATATDDAGNLHCVFNRYYSGYRVYYQRKNSGSNSFTSPVLVYNPGSYYAYRPSICITSDGVIHVSVATNQSASYNSLMHAWSTNNGASWNLEQVTPNYTCYYSYPTSICCDSDDNLYIAYTSYYSPTHIYVVSGTSGNWGTPEQVSHSTYSYVYYPSICCDTFNNVWVCWNDRRGSAYEIYYNKLDAESGTWEGDQALTSDDGQYSMGGQFAADEQGNVHICWYDSRDNNYEIYYNWYSGGGAGGRDLVCVRITQPVGDIPKDPVTPKAVILNNGGGVDSCFAKCVITGPGASYEKGNIEGIVYLEPEEQVQVDFPDWTPPGSGGDRYKVEVTVYLWPEKTTEDDDPDNNTKIEYATIEGGAQVDPIEIAVPQQGGVYHSMNPEATFKNIGEDPATDFYCYCEINSMGYMTEPYVDSFEVANLDPAATLPVTFTKEWVCDDSLGYEAKFFAAIPGEPRVPLGIEELVAFQGIPGIAEEPDALRIEVSGPNPFVKGTLVSYAVSYPASVTVRVYDVSGKVVRTLHEGELAGEGTLYWDGTDDASRELPGGLYFIRIATSEFTRTTKVVLVH